ncbi:MAG: 50S ribosomal protein L18 [bacterium]|nr:50S ribosomal protein L18 [bacterium]
MKRIKILNKGKAKRTARVRARIRGTSARPRLSIFRSNTSMYAQLINDEAGKTIVSATLKEMKNEKQNGTGSGLVKALALGKLLAEKAKKAGYSAVVFDRGAYAYHGRVKALADGAREGGLIF